MDQYRPATPVRVPPPPRKYPPPPPSRPGAPPRQPAVIPPRRPRTLRGALLITLAATVLPGTGHALLRRRPGMAILVSFIFLLGGATIFLLQIPQSGLVAYLLSTNVLRFVIIGCGVLALLWVAVILRTYVLARPRRLDGGRRMLGAFVVLVLCLAVITPFGYGAYLANSQRNLLNALFPNATSSDAAAIAKPRINVFLIGSDAGPDRIGARTDTMVVASIDTRTGRTTLLSLPRNLESAQFPQGSAMAQKFPRGFNDLLNAVYAYGKENPQVAPAGPSGDTGLNLLTSSVGTMLGISLDYYVEINMQGFADMIEALGGVDVDVGPERIPMGGIGPFGGAVKPFGYIEPGRQHLNGVQALWYARSRTNASDYDRMGRQRCLLQYLVDQKSPIDVLRNFQAVATAATNSLSTNIPQDVLRALVAVPAQGTRKLESVAFDPRLPDPTESGGHFDIGSPDFDYMKQVVRDVLEGRTPPAGPPPSSSTAPTPARPGASTSAVPQVSPAPISLEQACA